MGKDAKRVFELLGHEFDDKGNILVELETSDGKSLGKVTADAARAIEKGDIYNYKPKNDTERKVIESIKDSKKPKNNAMLQTYTSRTLDALNANKNKPLQLIGRNAYSASAKNNKDTHNKGDAGVSTGKSAETKSSILNQGYTSRVLEALNANKARKPSWDDKNIYSVAAQYGKDKYGKGNIDLAARPVYQNSDGTISTVDSITVSIDGEHIVLPTVVVDEKGEAKRLETTGDAVRHYIQTGEYLGKFKTQKEADEYAQSLHVDQDIYYSAGFGKGVPATSGTPSAQVAPVYGPPAPATQKNESAEPAGRSAGFWDVTINSIKKGYVQSLYGQETYKAMIGQKNNKAYYEEKLKSEDFSFIPDNKVEEWVSGAMELLGQQVRQWTDPRSLAVATAGAGTLATTAAIAGQAGPQIALPEEVVTVPAAAITGFVTGIQTGSTMANFEIEAGHAYNEMVENGISHETARNIALGVGAGNAALEMIQLDELVKGFKAIKHLDNADGFLKKLGKYLAERGVNVAKETAQEVGQEAVTMTGVNVAGNIDGQGTIIGWKDFGKRLGDTAVSSAMSFALLGTGGDAINYTVDKTSKAVTSVKSAVNDRQKMVQTGKTIRDIGIVQPVIQTGLDSPVDSLSYQLAQKAKNKGSKISNYDIGKLYFANVEQIKQEESAEQSSAKSDEKTTGTTTAEVIQAEKTAQQSQSADSSADIVPTVQESQSTKTVPFNTLANPVVSVGDVFKDTKYGNTITVVSRDGEKTVVSINTGVKAETRTLTNEQAGKLVTSEQYEPVVQSKPASETEAPAKTTTPQSEQPKVSVGDIYTAAGKTYTITGRNDSHTTYTVTDTNGNVVTMQTGNATADLHFTKPDVYTRVHSGAVTPTTTKNAPQTTATTSLEAVEGSNTTEGFKTDSDGKLRFNQAGIDYSNTEMRKGQFKVRDAKTASRTENGHIRGKYGIYKRESGMYAAVLLQSGMEVRQFKTLAEAKKAVTYLDDNLSFNDVAYIQDDGKYMVMPSEELKAYVGDIEQIVTNKPYSDSKAADSNETVPVGQIFEDYNNAVDGILSVSDDTAKHLADERTVVEVLKNTPDVILDNVEDARDLKVIINYNNLYLAVRKDGAFKGHYHNLGAEIAKRLPEFLKTPDAIIQLANGRLNLFTTVKTEKGDNGIVSVELNSTKDVGGKYEDYNVVVTMFSSGDNYIQNLISGEGVTVKYKKEDLSQVNPQLYKWLAIINDKSSIDTNISQDNPVVNSNLQTDTETAESASDVKSERESIEIKGKGKVKWSSLHPRQQAAIVFMEGLAKAANMDLVLTANAPFNGSYDIGGDTMYLDIYAGTDPLTNINDTLLPTASHELTHWMKFQAPALWSKLSANVFKALEEADGISKADRIANEIKRLKASKLSVANETVAEDEIVARACEDMLKRSEQGKKLFDSLSESEQKTFIDKVKEIIKNLKDWVSEMLSSYESRSYEANALKKFDAKLDEISKLWDETFAKAVEVSQATQRTDVPLSEKTFGKYAAEIDIDSKQTSKKAPSQDEVLAQHGLQYDENSKSIAPTTLFSERTWNASEYVQDEDTAVKAIVKAVGVSEADARRYIKNINSIARYIADNRDRLDYEPNVDDFATVLKSNKEYKWTVDMSTLCAKRLLYTGTFDAIQKRLPNKAFTSEDMVALRSMMAERGYEVACGICYVESTRRELGTITADFIDRYKLSQKTGKAMTYVNSKGEVKDLTKSQELMEKSFDKSTNKFIADKGYTPTLADLNTTDIDKVKTEHPLVYEAYVAFMKARGQATPKLLETRTEYKGEILKHFKSKTAVKSRNDAGGLRVQSFSDFEVAHLIDMMQIALDMSRVGLMSQAYTKVPAFADVFGDTGIKINLSLIAKDSGLDADGNLIFDDVEGMPHEEAFRLRDKHSKNVGTILVGKNDAHIKAALADPRIDFIIPFHKSFWKESLYEALGLEGYTDYTDTQNEKPYDKGRKIKNFQPSEYWDYNKSGEENAKTYLQMCKDDRRQPKFPQFQNEPGYWKLLIDFKMYDNDGVGSPQTVVKPEFDMEAANKIIKEYEGGHQQFPVAQDVVDDFVAQYKDGNGILYSERGENSLLPNDTNNGKITSHNLSESGDENGRNNEERTGDIGGRIGRVSEELGDKRRRDSSDSGDVSIGISALDSEEKRESTINDREKRKGSGSVGVDVGASSRVSTDAPGRERTEGRRFLEAVNSGDETTARKLLDKQALRSGFVPANVYHGTRAEEAFTQFNEGAAIWVSTSKKYAEGYASENTSGVKSYLFTEEDSAVYDLYVKHGNVLDLGNINEEFATPTEMLEFGKKIGFSKDDILKCFRAGRKYESYAKWTLSVTPEFAEIARGLGYDSLRAIERDGIETYGILYPENVKSAKTVTYDEDNNIIPLDERFNTKKNSILYSERETSQRVTSQRVTSQRVTEQEDAEYMEAYYDGDDDKLQELVDRVANRLGYTYKAFHRTENAFTVFDLSKARKDMDIQGFFFSADKDAEREYGSVRYDTYLKMTNPYIVDSKEKQNAIPFDMRVGNAGVTAREWLQDNGYDGVIRKAEYFGSEADEYIVFDSEQIKSSEPVTYSDDEYGEGDVIPLSERFNPKNKDIRFSERETAPTFYSHMAKTIDGIKQEKIGTGYVIPHLKNRGVKNEEIKWSGIREFLEGKKSVPKAELQEFVKNNSLQIETKELTSDFTIDYTEDERKSLDELSEVINEKWEEMESLWESKYGEEMPWDIRYHDNNVSALNYELIRRHKKDAGDESFFSQMHSLLDKVMTFESNQNFIVSRAENRTRLEKGNNRTKHDTYSLDGGSNYRELLFKLPGSTYSNDAMSAHWGDEGVLAHARVQDFEVDGKKMLFIEEIQSDWHNEGNKVGYVDNTKKLTVKNTEMRHENGWYNLYHKGTDLHQGVSEDFITQRFRNGITDTQIHEGLVGEYNRAISRKNGEALVPDAPFRDNYHEYVLKNLLRMATEQGYDSIGWTPADIQIKRWSDRFAKGYKIEYDQDIPKFLNKYGKQWDAKVGVATLDANGKKVWSMDITDAMRNSVLYEGQPLYSLRDDGVPDLFEAWEEAQATAPKTTTPKTTANSGVKSMAAAPTTKENVWVDDDATTTPDAKDIPTVSELIKEIGDAFGITIKSGKVMVRNASGVYKVTPEVIRTRGSNQLPTIIHELGHHLSKHYGLEKSAYINEADVLVDSNFLAQYSKADVPGELAAEFVRRYFKNPGAVAKACPNLTQDFLSSLSGDDAKAVKRIAPKVNTYMSAEAGDRYGATIISSKMANRLDKADLDDKAHELYTKWVDGFHPIKQLVDFVEDATSKTVVGAENAYKLATNSLNAHNISNFVLLDKFRDLNGDIISGYDSFVECVKELNLINGKTQKAFSEYLKLKHALEVQAKGKRVFADEVLGDVKNISSRIDELNQAFPKFEAAAKKLYDFQHNVLSEFAVKSGLMTQEQADFLRSEYPCYVPFHRYLKGKKGSFARKSLANQKSPIMKMKGSGLDTLDPLENIVKNTEKIISAAIKHQTVDIIGKYADTVDGIGAFIERVPPDQVAKTVGIADLKEKFNDELQHVVKNANDYFAVSDLLDKVFGDAVTGFSPVVNESERIIAVQRGDERAYYQIHNESLFESITELSPKQASGLMQFLSGVMGKTNALITQFSPKFAAMNPFRDVRTAYKLGDVDNPAKFIFDYVKAVVQIVINSDSYTQFKAMGGGHSSHLNAELGEITKSIKDLQMQDKGLARRAVYAITHHPIQLLTAFSDFTESIPRFMTFTNTYKKTGDLQEAMYQADDITTNFKRRGSGATAKGVNSLFRFNNAALQGLDKTRRTITDSSGKRKVQITAKWLMDAVLVSVLLNYINREKDEEGYENLSAYKKNNFYNFALGDGEFISLPKERENGVINSLIERAIDKLYGEDDSFYGFGEYLASMLLPPMIPGTANPVDAVHDLLNNTVIGGLTDIGFNKNFMGSPIESDYEKDLPSNERYNETSTSKLAYNLGQTKFAIDNDLSPKKIDHLISSYFGFAATANKALFPMSDSKKDVTMGILSGFTTDSNYSTDLLNRIYDNRDHAEREYKYYGTADKAVEYEQNAIMASYVSGMNDAIKALPEKEQRKGRAYLLKTLNEWDYKNSSAQSAMVNNLGDAKVTTDAIFDGLPKSTLEWSVDKQKYVYQMTPQEYYEYVRIYTAAIENARMQKGGYTIESYEEAKEAAKDYMSKFKKNVLKEQYLGKAVPKTD